MFLCLSSASRSNFVRLGESTRKAKERAARTNRASLGRCYGMDTGRARLGFVATLRFAKAMSWFTQGSNLSKEKDAMA